MAGASGTIEHTIAEVWREAFDEGLMQGHVGDKEIFLDRRHHGRRYWETDYVEELRGPQKPYPKGWQADIPFDRYKKIL
jgi:hypothetical protein